MKQVGNYPLVSWRSLWYNLRERWRENKKMVTNLATAIGVMMIPVGFLMMTTGISMWWILLAGVVGFGCLFLAIKQGKQDEAKADERFRELIGEIKKLRP